jgi:hypothetical protein
MDVLPSQRQLFDIPDEVAYFNCAYNSPQLNESRKRLHNGVNTKSSPWERTPESFFDDAETIRLLSSDIFDGHRDGFAVMPGAGRFDVGEKCTATILPGAIAALEQIKAWGVPRISNSLSIINKQIGLHLERLGFHLPSESQRCPHMFGALLPEHHGGNLVSELAKRNIYISQRGNAVRFAPHLHINKHDINRLFETLECLVIEGN